MKCEACDKQATHVYEAYGNRMHLCSSCKDQHEIQKAYNDRMIEIVDLSNRGDCDAALSILQGLLDAQGDRDHTGGFRYGILSHQALVLKQQGRFAEGLEKLRSINTFPSQSEFLVNQLAIAKLLGELGKHADAIGELERGLDAASESSLPTALSLFAEYARITRTESSEVPARFRDLFQDVVRWWGIPGSKAPEACLEPFSETIQAADKQRRE